jgi:hypothetical protein
MNKDMADLWQQLQLMKKQTMTALEQARKSADHGQSALRPAQESLELEKLRLPTPLDGWYVVSVLTLTLFFCVYHCAILFFSFISHMCVSGYCC